MNDTTRNPWPKLPLHVAASALLGTSLFAGCALEGDDGIDGVIEVEATAQTFGGSTTPRTPTVALPANPNALPGHMGYPGRTSSSFTQPAPLIVPTEASIRDPQTGMCLSSPAFNRHMGRSVLEHLPQIFFNYLEYGVAYPSATDPMLPATDDRMLVRDFMDLMGPETAYGVRYYQVQPIDPLTGATLGPPGPLEICVETYSATAESPDVLLPHFHIAIKDNLKDQWGNYLNPATVHWEDWLASAAADPYALPPYELLRIGSLEEEPTAGCSAPGLWRFQGGSFDTPCVGLHDEQVYEFDPLGSCGHCYKGPIRHLLTRTGLWFLGEGLWEPSLFVYDAAAPQYSYFETEPTASYSPRTGWSFGPGPTDTVDSRSSGTLDEKISIAKNEYAWRVATKRAVKIK